MNNTPKTEMVRVALTGEMIAWIKNKSMVDGKSFSQVIRDCISNSMKHN